MRAEIVELEWRAGAGLRRAEIVSRVATRDRSVPLPPTAEPLRSLRNERGALSQADRAHSRRRRGQGYLASCIVARATTDIAKASARYASLDANTYPKGVAVPDAEMAALNIECAEFHGEWNYTIRPTNRSDRAVNS